MIMKIANDPAREARTVVRNEALTRAIEWLKEGGQVSVLDGTYGSIERRAQIKNRLAKELSSNATATASQPYANTYRLLFIESQVTDPAIIERNFLESSIFSPDFEGMSREEALEKFRRKLEHYKSEYVGMEEELAAAPSTSSSPFASSSTSSSDDNNNTDSFIKIVDGGRKMIVNKIQGFLESKLLAFCANIHTHPRCIILTRHGQSDYNIDDRVGGDSDLTDSGREFAKRLAAFVESQNINDLTIWTSTLQRTILTAEPVRCISRVPWVGLMEIDAGMCEGMTYEEIKKKLPLEYAERQKNKLTWRYPRGESYLDVIKRLEPVIFELERQRKNVLVVAHRAVIRCLFSYFVGSDPNQIPFLPVPLHSLNMLVSTSRGWVDNYHFLGPDVGDHGAQERDLIVYAGLKGKQAKSFVSKAIDKPIDISKQTKEEANGNEFNDLDLNLDDDGTVQQVEDNDNEEEEDNLFFNQNERETKKAKTKR